MEQRRRKTALTLLEATQSSPALARLMTMAEQSAARLTALAPLIPKALHERIAPGPTEDDAWCLLVDNNAVAAKLRQLIPAMESHLRSQGFGQQSIRLRVRSGK
jgi:hypothetical protein